MDDLNSEIAMGEIETKRLRYKLEACDDLDDDYMWKWKSDWNWCLAGAYFLAKFQAGGAYSGGAYK